MLPTKSARYLQGHKTRLFLPAASSASCQSTSRSQDIVCRDDANDHASKSSSKSREANRQKICEDHRLRKKLLGLRPRNESLQKVGCYILLLVANQGLPQVPERELDHPASSKPAIHRIHIHSFEVKRERDSMLVLRRLPAIGGGLDILQIAETEDRRPIADSSKVQEDR